MLDIQKIRADFPILSQKVNGKPLVYFDNGATSQKPQVVIDAIAKYYQEINANIHRGVHTLSQLATDAYEVSREKCKITLMLNLLTKCFLLQEQLLASTWWPMDLLRF